jgi:hypothetical protein
VWDLNKRREGVRIANGSESLGVEHGCEAQRMGPLAVVLHTSPNAEVVNLFINFRGRPANRLVIRSQEPTETLGGGASYFAKCRNRCSVARSSS